MTVKCLWDHRGKEREIISLSAEKINFQPRILYQLKIFFKNEDKGFPGGAVVENPPANAGDTGSSPGLGRSHMPWSN